MSNGSATVVRIATRASQLALWQAQHVSRLLTATDPHLQVQIVHVSTTGDRVQSTALSEFGGVGVFTREVQHALLQQEADLAVHSLKDLPTVATPGLHLAAVPERELRYDALVLPSSSPRSLSSLGELPAGARIGTGSLRRQAQLRHLSADWTVGEVRGNVDTRLRKLDTGDYDALILAAAGLIRLGLSHRISLRLEPPVMFPAVGQGAIGIECRADDHDLKALLSRLTHQSTWQEVVAERSLLNTLRAGCHAPLGVQTHHEGDRLFLKAVVLSPDGSRLWQVDGHLPATEAVELGEQLAGKLLEAGAGEVLHASQDRAER